MAKMNKFKMMLVLLVIASMSLMMFALLPSLQMKVRADAHTTDLNQIDSVPISPVGYFSMDGWETHANIPTIGGSGQVFWHFIDSGGSSFQAYVEFEPVGGGAPISVTLNPYKVVGATHYGVYTPAGYELTDAYLLGVSLGKFTLSHTYYESLETTAPEVTTTAPEVTTTAPEVTTTAPEVTTTAPEVTTTAPEVTTTAPEVTTTAPEVTTTAPEVTTTEVLATTVEQTTTNIELTTESVPLASVTTTTTNIELTTESIPLASVTTTTIELTTESIPLASTIQDKTIMLTTDAIPQTGETSTSNNGLLIGLILMALAGSLGYVVMRRKPVEIDPK